jgi:DNA-binding NarL/FixJ family response regulator
MNILIDLGSHLMSEAIYQLLVKNGYDHVVVGGKPPADGLVPDLLLVDVTTVRDALLSRYPDAKVLLVDTGIEPEKLCVTLLSHRIHGVLSPNTELHLFKKALTAVSEGQIWIDNGSVKALLHDSGSISQKGKIGHISGREQEIIECIRQGLSNNEIARRLTLSPHTVKAHLNRIFRKFNITSRSKLMALAMNSPHATSA